MHYARTTFSKSGFESTLLPKDSSVLIVGQRNQLSEKDILQTNRLYNCPTCGRSFSSPNGQIAFFPNSDPLAGKRTCAWRIHASSYEKLKLVFNYTYFHFPCNKVYLEIRRGNQKTSPLVGRYCANKRPPRVIWSSEPTLWIKFHYGHEYYYDGKAIGFDASYTAMCGGRVEAENGEIRSPNYPNDNDLHLACTWDIIVPKGRHVLIRFSMLQLEADPRCQSDRVELFDGSTNTRLAQLCTSRLPGDVISSSNHVVVKFITDDAINKVAFFMSFSSESNPCALNNGNCSHVCNVIGTTGHRRCSCYEGFHLDQNGLECDYQCGGTLNAPKGIFTSPGFPGTYPANKRCTWQITVSADFVIALLFDFFELEESQVCSINYDHVEIVDRARIQSSRLCGIKGQRYEYISSGNKLEVIFSSDSTITSRGFKAHFLQVKNLCQTKNGGCDHICKMEETQRSCHCRKGFKLSTNGQSCLKDGCGTNRVSLRGWLASDDQFSECAWIVNTTEGQSYRVKFNSLMVASRVVSRSPCNDQALRFYTYDNGWKKTFEYCQGHLANDIVLPGNRLKVTFNRKPTKGYFAFNLTYSSVCGGHFDASRQPKALYSHAEYDVNPYPSSQNCTWHIHSRKGRRSRVMLRVRRLAVEAGSCLYDYVNIYDGSSIHSPLLARLCGDKLLRTTFRSTGSDMMVQFVSDVSVGAAGFWMEYTKFRNRNKRGYLQLSEHAHYAANRPRDRLF